MPKKPVWRKLEDALPLKLGFWKGKVYSEEFVFCLCFGLLHAPVV